MGLWSWLREPWSRPEAAQVSTPTAPADRAPAATPDPGWRALPPVQRTLADGVHSVAGFGDFAGSLSTWQTPRMLTELEHGRGPSAPSGSAVGIVDAVSGRPGLTQLPAAGVPLTTLPGSGTSAAVQREVRFDPPRGAAVLQRALSEAARSSAGVAPSEAPPTVVQRSDAPAASAPAAVTMPVNAVESEAEGAPPAAAPATSSPAASVEPSEPAVQRSAVDTGGWTGVADQPGPTLGSTPLQSTLAGSPAVLQRSAGTTERALPQLPVVPDRPAVHSFVTAPAPPTARPALPIVAGRPEVDAGGAVVQRAFAPAPAAATPASPAVPAVPAVSTPTTVSAVPVPTLPVPAPVESSTHHTPSPTEAPGRAPLLADDPVREVPSEVTSIADDVAPTVSRLAVGSEPVVQPMSASASSTPPRRLGLGAPLTRPPEPVPTRPDVSSAGPVVQMLPVGGPAPEARPAGIPAAGPEPTSPEPASSDAVQVAPAVDLPTVEPIPSALPADQPEVGPESSSTLAAEAPADPDPGFSWPAAPDHGTPLLGDRPIATAMPSAATPAVQRSAVDEVVPVRWGDPTEPGHAGPGPRGPSGSSPPAGRTGTGPQQGHPAAVQRSVGAPAATRAGGTAGTAAGASVQRTVGSGAGGDPGSVAVHAGLAQRAADGSVVFHPPSDGPAASLQRFGLPSMPKMPSVPSLPSMPAMPSLPSVPSLPGMPTLPNMPSGLPNMPGMPSGLPSLPNLPSGLPSLPNVPGLPSMPNLPSGLPSLPGIPSGLPSLPGMPSMPGIPDLPSMPGAVDEIRDRAGSAVSTASDAVSGAVGQAADTATGALGQAADTASGAVGQAVDAAKGAVGQATGAAGALAAASTDELVRRLFDPLAARLKAELRLDRERAGFVTDLRR